MTLNEALKAHFQLDAFRPGQEAVIRCLLQKQDVLAVMPTGQGKSLCYQLPALLSPGVSLVVSPLISLMKDQVDRLKSLGLPATFINSTLSPGEQQQRMAEMEAGKWKLVYIAPERFRSGSFLDRMRRVQVDFFAVDEAHCLSQWGHDFRPDYLWLGKAIELLGRPVVGAFTATATPHVRTDILEHLHLRAPQTFVTGFSRPNLSLRVLRCAKRNEKFDRLRLLVGRQKTGIIYCATRKRVEEVAARMLNWGIRYVSYHGGMEDAVRREAQEQFMNGSCDVAVATNAFGMGIDRRDIRFVAHFEVPGSIEAYYQEVGRAGRDGKASECELYYNFADRRTQDFFIDGGNPSPELICEVYSVLRAEAGNDHTCALAQERIKEIIGRGANGMAVGGALSWLRRSGMIERFDVPGQRVRHTRLLQPGLPPRELKIDTKMLARKRDADESRLEKLLRYCQSKQCRQQYILEYFGEADAEPCGCCDRCLSQSQSQSQSTSGTRALGEEELTLVKKALSGLARASIRRGRHEWEPKVGRGTIIQMLVGRRPGNVTRQGLDKVSTFGLLRKEGPDFLHKLFDAMEAAGWVEVVGVEFPLAMLTQKGSQIMLGEKTAVLAWPDEADPPLETAAGEDLQLEGDTSRKAKKRAGGKGKGKGTGTGGWRRGGFKRR